MRNTVFIGVMLAATTASADCSRSSLDGTWVYTAINIQNAPNPDVGSLPGNSLVERCTFEIENRGSVASVDCDNNNSDIEFETGKVTFQVDNDCSFTLRTVACFYGGNISADRTTASGVADCNGDFDPFSPAVDGVRFDSNFFNLTRQ